MCKYYFICFLIVGLAFNLIIAESEENQNESDDLIVQNEESIKLLRFIFLVRKEIHESDRDLRIAISNNTNKIYESINEMQTKNLNVMTNLTNSLTALSQQVNALENRISNLTFENENLRKKLQHVRAFKDCATALRSAGSSSKHVFKLLHPLNNEPPFYAYCIEDLFDGEPWTIIMRRIDGLTSFDCTWNECKHGFGNASGEYFLGLELLHQLTYAQPHELWLQLEDNQGNKYSPMYDDFRIGSEQTAYALEEVGIYRCTGYDQLFHQVKQKFSTKDKDNDKDDNTNCAIEKHGPGWFKYCDMTNLFGPYGIPVSRFEAMRWGWWPEGDNYLEYVHMAIRPLRK